VTVAAHAREANAPERWDALWSAEETSAWRAEALSEVYIRIERIIGMWRALRGDPRRTRVIDIGGGIGVLAGRLTAHAECDVTVYDHSPVAIAALPPGVRGVCADVDGFPWDYSTRIVVSTECLEHLSLDDRRTVVCYASLAGVGLFSVPNDRLGPDEEPQHTVKFTAVSFAAELREYFKDVRVEVLGGFLLGVCGIPKGMRLSVTMPVRDEEHDIERTLASFRGVADELVVGIDPRSTDGTRAICEKYADVVFDLVEPEGPPDDRVPAGGVHFAWLRNQCIERCTGDWIFMTEGHERLAASGVDTLLLLEHVLPRKASVGFVLRTGNGQQWAFPWLFKNAPAFRFKRSTHNVLDYPEGTYVVRLPQVRTIHERHADKNAERKAQRKVQNRLTLFEDWLAHGNENSLYYLGSEWREYDDARAVKYLEQFIAAGSRNGEMRYQAKLVLAKTHMIHGDKAKARDVLVTCIGEDWSRVEHWLWLGDLAFDAGKLEEALQFYRYAATTAGEPPFTLWWIDLASYTYLPAQRLAMVYGELGRLEDAARWAVRVRELLPEGAPAALFDEAAANIKLLQDAISRRAPCDVDPMQ